MFEEKFVQQLAGALAPRVADALRPQIEARSITPRYLNLDQAAQYMSTTADSVRGMLRAKRFPARQIGKRVFIDVKDIDQAMDEGVHYL
jgi:excisionase family DNA binding protein